MLASAPRRNAKRTPSLIRRVSEYGINKFSPYDHKASIGMNIRAVLLIILKCQALNALYTLSFINILLRIPIKYSPLNFKWSEYFL